MKITHSCRYAWLGYSDNHVKSGKVVLFHENEEWSSSSLLAAFGDVYGVFLKYGYGKYAARFGLSFSSTLDVQDVSFFLHFTLRPSTDGHAHYLVDKR